MPDNGASPKMIGTTGRGTLNGAKLSTLDADNHAHLLAWIQSVALGYQKEMYHTGLDSLSAAEKTEVRFKTYIRAITEHTKFVQLVGDESTNVSQETHKGSINVSKIMEAAMGIYAGAEALAAYKELNDLIGTKADDVGVSNFMNFWWSHVERTESDTSLKIGPAIYNEGGEIQFTILFSSWTFSVDDWRTLFIESDYESFSTAFVGKTFAYTAEQWLENGPDIEARLDPEIKSSIQSAPLG